LPIILAIPPGSYIFRVKGSNNDGVWNKEGTSVKITILPPWWLSGWAYTLYAVLFGLTLYGLRRIELKRVRLNNELEKKRFEARKLKEIDELKSRFFSNISHEFRTPLTLILGPLQKFLSNTEDRERREDMLAMQRNARRLQQLIDQLLDLSKLDAQGMPLRARPGNIVQKVRELTSAFASLAESKDIVLHFTAGEESITVFFDTDKLEKIIYNLLGNAFMFTPDGGKIFVELSRQTLAGSALPSLPSGNYVEIRIRDTGRGIPSPRVNKIFDRFYQVDDGSTRTQAGTGIGLALTREFVELHHGKIRLESEVGKGSTFTILLPLGRDHLTDAEVVDHTPEQEAAELPLQPTEHLNAGTAPVLSDTKATDTNGRPLVLIVEDNQDMRRFLHNCLAQIYDILEAENGESGHQAALERIPDMIVSDVMMPEMDGFEFCRRIKTDERTSHIPIILLTARASKESKLEGLDFGADDYLVKPFDADELIVRVRNLIDQRQKLRERFGREITVKPQDITITSIDEKFLQRAINIVEENISNSDFDIDQFCREMAMSRSTLNRKLRALTDFSSNGFIRTLRLKRASQLLQKKSATVVEIAYEVGFNNPSYFAECFRTQFGTSPSEYASG
jgi:signal transduction histidine kinase/DNA-binding response OmpR family regulator